MSGLGVVIDILNLKIKVDKYVLKRDSDAEITRLSDIIISSI
ncbi:hypothetical protein [Borrelia persica]|nr:hypothetical protein [Borrelia persica]